jgi:hypothetical protein
MAKDAIWNIRVDGTRHEILARDKGNSFDIYVDDEFRFNVRSDINLDIEEDLTVGSKRCRVVVYRGVPDLAVDGILVNAEADILKAEQRNRRLTILAGMLMMLLGMVAAWAWTIIYAGGESHFGGVGGIIFAAVMFLAGFLLVVHTLKKRVSG